MGQQHRSSVASFVANRNWKFAFDRVRDSNNRRGGGASRATFRAHRASRASMRPEWGKFSEEQLELLFSLADAEGDDVGDPDDVLELLEDSGARFMTQCLVVAMEHRDGDKFRKLFALVDKALEGDRLAAGLELWPKIFPDLFQKAVEMGNLTALRNLLSLAHESSPPRLPKRPNCSRPNPNDPSLLAACRKDDYEMVKLFVSYGYRIKMSVMTMNTKTARIARGETTWRDYAEFPFLNEEQWQMGREDQIYTLFLLKMLSRPSYIFACYNIVAEGKDIENEEKQVICECENRPQVGKSAAGGRMRMGLNEVMMSMATGDDVFHYCPSNEKYSPHPDCVHHMECNDPIYRCFDIANMASEGGKRLPEYRTEFTEIAQNCRSLAARILDHCETSEQVTVLFEEKAASMKYFNYHTSYIRFPRVRLAVEHSHKEFVSHMNCQQFLKTEWLGRTNWFGKMLPYKILYFLLQTICAPFHVLHALIVFMGRDIRTLNDGVLPDVSSAKTKFQGLFFAYLHYCDKVALNLDAPINRFLVTVGYFDLSLALVVIAAIRPLSDKFDGTSDDSGDFAWYHICLIIYSVNELYKLLLMFGMLRGVSHFFNVWRMSSLLSQGCIFCGLMILWSIHVGIPCEYWTKNLYVCPDDVVEQRQRLSDVSACLFGFGSIGAVMRLTYYMQMHDRAGPIIINYSRVAIDFLTMTIIYALMILAFSFGFAHILSSNYFVGESVANSTAVVLENSSHAGADFESAYGMAYTELLNTLFWSILNPGPSDLLSNTFNARFTVVAVEFAFYQVFTVIVFLNLLIATMNSTVQRVESQKETFWKFTRTSIWIEFYDVTAVLPPPFTMLNVVWLLIYGLFLATKKSRTKLKMMLSGMPELPLTSECGSDRTAYRKRMRHARLMVELLEKILKGERMRKSKEERDYLTKDDLAKLKREIVEEVVSALKQESLA